MKSKARMGLLVGLIVVVIVVVDQLAKGWVVRDLPAYTPIDVVAWLRPVLSFTYVKNTGASFGMFQNMNAVLAVLSVIVLILMVIFQRTIPPQVWIVHVALALVMGGALGNLIDRITRGYVVDFFDVNFWPFAAWPVFNVADSAIVVGVAILLVDSFFLHHLERATADA
ncbi:MAG: signal peptidase II [Chloroflexi bacterium]|nr:signal peptidase II [Chloroflexota bacterium]